MKTCSKCKIEKSLTEFSKGNCKKDGRAYWCKVCVYENSLSPYGLAINRASSRKANRLRDGWAHGEHEKAEAAEPFVTKCACCGSVDPRRKSGWVADHNRKTGMFRAHVCHPCNLILGYAERYGLCRDSADIDLYLVKYNV